MAPGPYQSNLFRFAIAQYRQGVDRHRRAVQGARSTAVLGLGIGAAVTVFPVYRLARASQTVGRKLREAVTNRRLLRIGPKVAELLDFSDFDSLPGIGSAAGDDALPSTGESQSTQAMVRTLWAVGACLSHQQVLKLSVSREALCSSGDGAALGRLRTWGQQLSAAFSRQVMVDGDGKLTDTQEGPGLARELSTMGQITGVASDLTTRSLVLITGHTVAWSGLSSSQQRQLQAKIGLFLQDDYPIQTEELVWMRLVTRPAVMKNAALSEGMSSSEDALTALVQRLSPDAASMGQSPHPSQLTRPIQTFWVDVLRVVSWLYQHRGLGPIAPLSSRLSQLVGQSFLGPTVFSQVTFSQPTAPQSTSLQPESSKVRSSGRQVTTSPTFAMTVVELVVKGLLSSKDPVHEAMPVSVVLPETTPCPSSPVLESSLPKQAIVKMGRAAVKAPNVQGPNIDGKNLNDESGGCLEADVIAVDYIEHPLEKLLKWVDRLLLWVEKHWQSLKDWLFRGFS